MDLIIFFSLCIIVAKQTRVMSSRPGSPTETTHPQLVFLLTPCRTRLLRACCICLAFIVVTGPSQNRACAIYAHGSSHSYFTEKSNILTMIRGFGSGNRFSISLNFSQLRQFFFPLRFSHLNSRFFTSFANLAIPRELSVTP